MVAKTYDEAKGFDLAEQYDLLRDGTDQLRACLREAKFETIPESTILQCVAGITLSAVRGKDILKIPRGTFIPNWETMTQALFTSVDFIRTELRVPVSQLIPYPAVLVPFVYYFHRTGNKKPSNEQVRLLEQFFYWVGLTERYSSALEGKIAEDFNKMDLIAKGNMPAYQRTELSIDAKQIEETSFSAGNAYCKTILCLLAYHQPKSFDTDGLVILDNSNLKIATSRNYHHFFPSKYLGDNHIGKEPNKIANITLIDGYLNKHRIGRKPPSEYIRTFAETNPRLPETLQSHLIKSMDAYGLTSDDYDSFIKERAKAIALALNLKLMSITPVEAAEQEKAS
jgi:hypothetical protein